MHLLRLLSFLLITAVISAGTASAEPAWAPRIYSLSPSEVAAGSNGFTLVVSGQNMGWGSEVLWNGAALSTRPRGGSQLEATVPSSLLTSAGTVQIQVVGKRRASNVRYLTIKSAAAVESLQITTSGLPAGQVGSSYSFYLQAAGGSKPYAWSASGSTSVPGLNLDSATGRVYGTPSRAGSFSGSLTVHDSTGKSASKQFSLVVNGASTTPPQPEPKPQPQPVQISTTALDGGKVGVSYQAVLAATGGTQPYAWSTTSGALPAGIVLSAAGRLSGTPSQAGSFAFTMQVKDAAGQTASRQFSLAIASPTSPLAVSTSSLPAGTVSKSYQAALAATGGTLPYNWSRISGSLPAGVSLSSAGQISGTPSASGSFTFVVEVRDAATQTASRAMSITIAIAPAPAISGLTPNKGLAAGGESITINGSNFQSGASVKFEYTTASVTFISSSQLRAVAPAHGAALVSVSVSNPDGQSVTLPAAYTYENPAPTGGTGGGGVGNKADIFENGFESGSTAGFDFVRTGHAWSFPNDASFCAVGNRCAQMDLPSGFTQKDMGVIVNASQRNTPDKAYYSMWFRFASNWTWDTADSDHKLILFEGNSRLYVNLRANSKTTARLALLTNSTSTWRYGPTVSADNKWHHIEVQPDTSADRVRVWLDGELVLDVDIPLGGTRPYGEIKFGAYMGGGAPARTMYLDNIAICTQRVGNGAATAGNDNTAPQAPSTSEGLAPDTNDAILFQDDFEGGNLSKWDEVNSSRYTVDSAFAKSGQRSLKATVSQSNWSGELNKWFMPGADDLYVKFNVYFEAGFTEPNYGMHLVGFYANQTDSQWSAHGKAGIVPDGTDFFSTTLDPEPPSATGAAPGLYPLHFYSYWPEMMCKPGDAPQCWGNYINQDSPKEPLKAGQWYEVVVHIKANTPGQHDGSQTLWINGVKKIDQQNMRFRDTLNLKVNEFNVQVYMQNGPSKTESVWFDDLVIWSPRQ